MSVMESSLANCDFRNVDTEKAVRVGDREVLEPEDHCLGDNRFGCCQDGVGRHAAFRDDLSRVRCGIDRIPPLNEATSTINVQNDLTDFSFFNQRNLEPDTV